MNMASFAITLLTGRHTDLRVRDLFFQRWMSPPFRRMVRPAWVAGVDREWDAEITEQVPEERISWHSVSGPDNGGTVLFEPIDADRTRLTMMMDYDPKGFVENAGDVLGVVERRVEGDLERFRSFIEKTGRETGAWRGEVHGRNVS